MLVNVTSLPVLELPNPAAPVVGKLERETLVYEVRRLDQWVEIRSARERLGWVQSASLRLPAHETAKPSGVGAVLSAMAIAALIVNESRQAYYATGRPCACPEDRTTNGRRCGGNSAYNRPGGARPLCYPADVPLDSIEAVRAILAKKTNAGESARR
jgi:hypothetical protein